MGSRIAKLIAVVAVIGVTATLVALGVRSLLDRVDTPLAEEARCELAGTPYSLSTEQAANAATVTAVAVARKLPQRAAVIALATALQESKLVNVEHGDRDSIGLFQQRPSAGWGTEEQILVPRYSAGKFYETLVKVKNWQKLPITEAAQAVQRSGFPEAYQQWVDQATVLAKAFSGAAPAAITCAFPAPTKAAEPTVVARQLGLEVPVTLLGSTVRAGDLRPASWTTANWLIAHADRLGIEAVTMAGQRWHRSDGWSQVAAGAKDRVRFEMAVVQSPAPA